MITTGNGPGRRKRLSPSASADDRVPAAHTESAQKALAKPRSSRYRIPPGVKRREHDGRGAYRWPIWPTSLTWHHQSDRKDHQ